jgi:pyruvate dehydrogenase E2 component (dihydrolipoyllysine-residue acetyltransferase)
MPRLSDQMEEGTILRWTKSEGEDVAIGEPIAEIETDKATWVVEAESAGSLLRIVVEDGGVAAVGGVIGFIGMLGETVPDITATETAVADAVEERTCDRGSAGDARTVAAGDGPPFPAGRARATPVARRTAAQLRIPLEHVVGTGPGGRIVNSDVLAAARASAAPDTLDRGSGTSVQLTPTQRTIARRMVESATTIPLFTVAAEIDMEAAVGLRADLQQLRNDEAPSLNDLIVKAVALALRDFPALNSSYDGGQVVRWTRVNVGIAVATADALIVPVLFDADQKPLEQIARETRDLVARTHARELAPAELAEGTFTVSNLGMFGARRFSALINPPQAAILAVGEVSRRAVVDETGALVARHRMDVTLACDHRIVYGAGGARFLARVRELLERPLALTL